MKNILSNIFFRALILIGGFWSIVEAYSYFAGDELKLRLGVWWWWCFYVLPILIAIIYILYNMRTGHKKGVLMDKQQLLQNFKQLSNKPIDLQSHAKEVRSALQALLRDNTVFVYADLHDILVPNLNYSPAQLCGGNPLADCLANRLVEQSIADNKLNKLVEEIRELKPHLFT